ncbi:MAG: RNA polymerase sigma factor [Bacteroidetes bacterium HGW-Bacteroidetes-6]|jgi:RNA polymerase sigma-70 factor (ECF subfamily)|nr:MAG: RNA polymerase sigma factor [Bacteroidetes bacterium HGW-Bacteroidetes-6]
MDKNEFNRCVELYSDAVYRFIMKHTADEDDAADIVQESFVRMWEKAETVSFEKAKSYLFSTAYHAMIDYFRKKKRFTGNFDFNDDRSTLHPSSPEKVSSFDLKAILNEALDRLPEIQKSVILLRDYEGYSYEEIGEITGLNESQVKVYIYRGRIALKNFIKNPDLVL